MIVQYIFLILGKPHLFKRNVTLGVSDTIGIAFSMTVIAYPEPLYELRYDNGTRNTRMVSSISRNAVNNFTIHFKQTVVEQDDYGIYHLLVNNALGESIVILNVLPQSKYCFSRYKRQFILLKIFLVLYI